MTWQKYRIGDTVSKTVKAVTLWQTEKGVIEIDESSLVVPIKFGDQQRGYIFHGDGKLLLDAIVEIEEGAVGKSVDKRLNEPFLMIGTIDRMVQQLTTTNKEDFIRIGDENQEEFLAKAKELCSQFLKRGVTHNNKRISEKCAAIFAFPNRARESDVLVCKGSKLVYKTMEMIFVLSKNKSVLKSPTEMIVSRNGKSVFVAR